MFTIDEAALEARIESVVRRVLGSMFQGDRRKEPRPAQAARTCPVKGCPNAFAPRFGGWCEAHRNTAAFKAWAAKLKAKRGAKKR